VTWSHSAASGGKTRFCQLLWEGWAIAQPHRGLRRPASRLGLFDRRGSVFQLGKDCGRL